MEIQKLKDICLTEITDGTHQTPTYSEYGYIFLSSKNVTTQKIDWDNVMFIPEKLHEELYKRVAPQIDDILLAKNGTTGVAAIVDRDIVFDIYVSLALIRPNTEIVMPRYLLYAINNPVVKGYFDSSLKGIGVPNLHLKNIRETPIKIYDLETQKAIVEKLDKVCELISLRKQQLAKLDELVKARFVEMFGDEQAFNKEPLSQNVEEMFIGPFGSSLKNENFVSKENGYCMVYEQKHAIRKTMDVETRYIDKPKYEELKRFSIHGGDIIVSCRGTIGETYIVPLNAPLGIMHPSIMKIRVKDSIYNRVFFDFLLQEKLKQHEAQANGSGVKMAVTASALGKEEFIVPSIPFQNQFAAFVERVDQQKQTVQQSLEKLELMKKARMQEYFG